MGYFQSKVLKRLRQLKRRLDTLNERTESIMASQNEAAATLNAVNEKLVKVGGETRSLLTKIDELIAAAESAPVNAELQAAIDAVKSQADTVDNLVPDAPA